MSIPTTAYVAAGAILAALVTGAFTFVNLLISKEQKTSEFRQSWIDAFRNDLAELIASYSLLMKLWTDIGCLDASGNVQEREERKKLLAENLQLEVQVEACKTRLLLRINPKEHVSFVQSLQRLLAHIEVDRMDLLPRSAFAIKPDVDAIIGEAQTLLKKEWNRVKRGERLFWITKYLALILLVALLALGSAAVWRNKNALADYIVATQPNKTNALGLFKAAPLRSAALNSR